MTVYLVTTTEGPNFIPVSTFVKTEEEALERAKKWIKDMVPNSVVTVECCGEEEPT